MTGPGNHEVVVIGGGYAGAATAFFLSRLHHLQVTLVEQESTPGVHSSGRNAGLVRSIAGHPEVDRLAREGAEFLADLPGDFRGDPGFRRTGSIYLGRPEQVEPLRLAGTRRLTRREVQDLVPAYRAADPLEGVWTEADGTVDMHAYLAGYLDSAAAHGCRLLFSTQVQEIARGASGFELQTSRGTLSCSALVVAAGAWAARLARQAGVPAPRLVPYRRHVLIARARQTLSVEHPYLWDLHEGFYLRPYLLPGGTCGLLLSACDEEPDRAGDCAADPAEIERIVSAAKRLIPDLIGAEVRSWAGHRTRGPEEAFVLGCHEQVPGWYWAAGLGGHGLTCSAAVGRRVAAAVVAGLDGRAQSAASQP